MKSEFESQLNRLRCLLFLYWKEEKIDSFEPNGESPIDQLEYIRLLDNFVANLNREISLRGDTLFEKLVNEFIEEYFERNKVKEKLYFAEVSTVGWAFMSSDKKTEIVTMFNPSSEYYQHVLLKIDGEVKATRLCDTRRFVGGHFTYALDAALFQKNLKEISGEWGYELSYSKLDTKD